MGNLSIVNLSVGLEHTKDDPREDPTIKKISLDLGAFFGPGCEDDPDVMACSNHRPGESSKWSRQEEGHSGTQPLAKYFYFHFHVLDQK